MSENNNACRCIYCLRSEGETRFTKREHIIPGAIGGIYTLDLSMVCDECNEYFSPIEMRFVRNTQILRDRLLSQKKGRHGVVKTPLCVVECRGEKFIGYAKQGSNVPYEPAQFIVTIQDRVQFQGDASINPNDAYETALKTIKSMNMDDIIHIDLKDVPIDRIYIAFDDSKVFSFKNPAMNSKQEVNLIELITKGNLTKGNLTKYDTTYEKRRGATMKATLKFNIDEYNRIICKIAFNTFAKFNSDAIYDEKYNTLRRYIRYGENPNKAKYCYESRDAEKCIKEIKCLYKITDISHCIYIANHPNCPSMFGIVSLYGRYNYVIKVWDEVDLNKTEVFYVNEVDSNREYNLF